MNVTFNQLPRWLKTHPSHMKADRVRLNLGLSHLPQKLQDLLPSVSPLTSSNGSVVTSWQPALRELEEPARPKWSHQSVDGQSGLRQLTRASLRTEQGRYERSSRPY